MNLLRSIVQSDWFLIVAGIWGLIALAAKEERESFLSTIGELLTKPVIFRHDENSKSIRFYPRDFLETIATVLTSGVFSIIKNLVEIGKSWQKTLEERYSTDDSSVWKMIGSVLLLIAMIAFFYADLIAIFNTLNQIGLITEVPILFRPYEYAVTFGSFFTIVLAGFILIEIFGKPRFLNLANQTRAARILLTWFSIALVVSSIAVAIGLGLDRYGALLNLNSPLERQIDSFNILVLTVLVPLNSIVATFIIVSEGLQGIPIVGNLISQIAIYTAIVVLFVFAVFNYPVWFVVDGLYRALLISSYSFFFYVLTPIEKMLSWKPFSNEREADK